ncbi:MAG: lycopene cyclase domain-containing protein [Micrococcales bacterium]
MNYLLLNFVFTLIAIAIAWPMRKRISRKIAIPTGLALAIITAIFDNIIVGAGIVAYDESKILGWRLLTAPIEDFGYVIVGVWLIPALYRYFEGKSNA